MKRLFKKILIANRGEIAIRVMRACRELGIATVAVYSDADRDAIHRRYADESIHIGAAPPSESYLKLDRIIKAASDSGAEAIHPGYGFLSERAAFPEACKAAHLAFIGPPAEAMHRLGDKLSSRALASKHGVPVTPGTGAIHDLDEARRAALEIGLPVIIKPSGGGGGIGMKVVEREEELRSALESAANQARAAFGDPTVYLEKYVHNPRHIEIQVIGDQHGHVLHLGERECSIQRRHQKILEESPSPAGPGVRVDSGYGPATEVPANYDSLVAKLIVYGADRAEAIGRAQRALAEFVLAGPATTIPYHRAILASPDFKAGKLSTGFIAEHPELLEDMRKYLDEVSPMDYSAVDSRRLAAAAAAVSTVMSQGQGRA